MQPVSASNADGSLGESLGRWMMTAYEKLGADVRPLKHGLTPRLRTSHGPVSTGRAMFRALPQPGGFA
jgi:hypothetical protein